MPNLEKMLIKSYENTPLAELADAPVWALQGVSKGDAEKLKKAFNVNTIADLAELKYIQWARDIMALAATERGKEAVPEFSDRLDKKFETKTPQQLLRLPVSVLQGVSKNDEKLLLGAFKVKTVKGLATLKYAAFAEEIVELHNRSLEMLQRQQNLPGEKSTDRGCPNCKYLAVLALVLIALFAAYYFGCFEPGDREQEKAAMTVEEPVKKDTVPEEKTAVPVEVKNKEEIPSPKPIPVGTYCVKPGDTLVLISERELGTWKRWPELYEKNRKVVLRPDHLYPGMELALPEKNN